MAKKNTGGARKSRGVPDTQSIRRHRKYGGRPGKSPKLRHILKRMAEANEIKDRSKIIDPVSNVTDLFMRTRWPK